MNTSVDTISSPKLIVTVDDSSMLNKIKNAIKMLRGVGNISVITPKSSELDLAREDAKAGALPNGTLLMRCLTPFSKNELSTIHYPSI